MKRVLTGIQSSGDGAPHLGNILGAILPGIRMSQDPNNEAYFFIANLHSLTSIKDGDLIRRNTYSVAAAWLAFGFDTDSNVFYRQSDLAAEVCELNWYLNCFTPYPMLSNATSFKDKSDRLSDVNSGLFTYPVLMAADIIGYDAHYVPVGKDQQQHLEITRDIARSINSTVKEEIFVIPEGKYDEKVMIVPGTDGQKMSKSYGNFIDIFVDDKSLRKTIMKKIVTDNKGVDDVKDPDTCNVFALYRLLASEEQIAAMRANYAGTGYGYGHAKQELYELILDQFSEAREKFNYYMENTDLLDAELEKGAAKARKSIQEVLKKLRPKFGY